MTVLLDGALMTDRAGAHAYLMEQFQFPTYYGKNLDALFDLLSGEGRELAIEIQNAHLLEENLGGYGEMLLTTIREAAEENPRVRLVTDVGK